MGAENTTGLEMEESESGLTVKGSPHHAPTEIAGPAPTGTVTAYFRDDAARIESPDHQGSDEITLNGTIALRTYPSGPYRYPLPIRAPHFTVHTTHLTHIAPPA